MRFNQGWCDPKVLERMKKDLTEKLKVENELLFRHDLQQLVESSPRLRALLEATFEEILQATPCGVERLHIGVGDLPVRTESFLSSTNYSVGNSSVTIK